MQILVILHSLNRYVLVFLLLIVIGKSLMGWVTKSPFEKADDKLSLFLFISTHTQLLLGLILYFFGSAVIFSSTSMKEAVARYWLVEHSTGMLTAVVLISLGRISSKRLADSTAKHKRMFVYNITALLLILVILGLSHRGFFSVSW